MMAKGRARTSPGPQVSQLFVMIRVCLQTKSISNKGYNSLCFCFPFQMVWRENKLSKYYMQDLFNSVKENKDENIGRILVRREPILVVCLFFLVGALKKELGSVPVVDCEGSLYARTMCCLNPFKARILYSSSNLIGRWPSQRPFSSSLIGQIKIVMKKGFKKSHFNYLLLWRSPFQKGRI